MGQSTSTPSFPPTNQTLPRHQPFISINQSYDYTSEIPDECLSLIFQNLRSTDRKSCSLVCKRWLTVDGQCRHRLALDASIQITPHLSPIFQRFDSVTKLALRCDRKSISLNDESLIMISLKCPNLTRFKIRGCTEVTEKGMLGLASNCKGIKKLSIGSCVFGAKGVNAFLENCGKLEELSVKRLRGISGGASVEPICVGKVCESLKSLCLKELHNGQCFGPLVVGCKNLKSLKIFRCLGDWDRLFESLGDRKVNSLVEIHLDRLQITDVGLRGISKCRELEVFHLVKAPDCSDDGVTAIAESCRSLRKLHIDGWRTNMIGDVGLVSIAKYSVNLVELVLIGVNPSSVSLMAVAGSCLKLERLALCGSETIGDAEISCIGAKCTALKKLCIKNCNVTDSGIRSFANGCPNLVKIKVKKCRGVTSEVADWLRARRVSLVVNLDGDEVEKEAVDASTSDGGVHEEGVEFPPMIGGSIGLGGGSCEAPSTSNGGRWSSVCRLSLFVGCTFRRLSNGSGCSNNGS